MVVNQFSATLIAIMKSAFVHDGSVNAKTTEFISQVGKELDRCKVYNLPTAELSYLYDTALWLKSQAI